MSGYKRGIIRYNIKNMSNMSYCQFHNTLDDLRDCQDALRRGEIESEEELRKAKLLVELCRDIGEQYDENDLEVMEEDNEDEE